MYAQYRYSYSQIATVRTLPPRSVFTGQVHKKCEKCARFFSVIYILRVHRLAQAARKFPEKFVRLLITSRFRTFQRTLYPRLDRSNNLFGEP